MPPADSDNVKSFGQRLSEWRKARGVSVYFVDKVSGVKASNLVAIEKGRRAASDSVIRQLSEIPELGLTYEQLMDWKAAEIVKTLYNPVEWIKQNFSREFIREAWKELEAETDG